MRHTTIAALAALALLPGLAGSQEGGAMTQEQMMELWQKWATTDEHHKELAWFVGKWDVEARMMGSTTPEKGTVEFKWIMEGRWLAQDYKGTLMGMPYQGYGISGFDRVKKKWVETWVSNMDTAMLRFEGTVVDPTGKVKSLYGTLDEWTTGEHDKPIRGTTRKIDADHFVHELWDLGIGAEVKVVLEFSYTRQK